MSHSYWTYAQEQKHKDDVRAQGADEEDEREDSPCFGKRSDFRLSANSSFKLTEDQP